MEHSSMCAPLKRPSVLQSGVRVYTLLDDGRYTVKSELSLEQLGFDQAHNRIHMAKVTLITPAECVT